MKNLLILIVGIAIFLHFYPQPEVEEWYEETFAYVGDFFGDTFDTQSRLSPKKILIDLQGDMPTFKIKERQSLEELTSSRHNVKDFYEEHCSQKKRAREYRTHVQQKICHTVQKYVKLL